MHGDDAGSAHVFHDRLEHVWIGAAFDLRGRMIRVLPGGRDGGAGYGEWDGRDGRGDPVPPGVYFLRWPTPEGVLSRRMILVR